MAAVPSIGRASLVEASRGAPEAAVTQDLYERHAARIKSYCLHRLGTREEAEDAVQTTFMNAFRALGRGVVPEAEAAWLYKIAENVCLTRRRSSWRRGRVESPADLGVIEAVAPAATVEREELIGLEDALASMPEQQRRAILLREWQGLSYREVAEELGLSQSAVETLIFRARRSLAQGLEQPVMRPKRLRRALHALDLGPILGALKTLLAGSTAAKGAAAAVAVTAAVGVTSGSAPTTAPAPAQAAAPAVTAKASNSTPAAKVQTPAAGAARDLVRPTVVVGWSAWPAAAGRAASRRPLRALPVQAAARKDGVPAARAQLGQTRGAVASQGRSAAARARPVGARGVATQKLFARGRTSAPATVPPFARRPVTLPPRPAQKPVTLRRPTKPAPAGPQAVATLSGSEVVTPAEPIAGVKGKSRAAAAREK